MRGLGKVLTFMRPYKRPLAFSAALTGLLTIIGMAPPLLMRRLINDVAREGEWGIFPLIITLLFAVPLFQAIVNVVNSITLNRVTLGVIRETRRRLFDRLLRLSMSYYKKTPVGSLRQRLMDDVANISGIVTGGIITLLTDVIAVAFAVVAMFLLSPMLLLLVLALLPLYYLNYWFFSGRMQAANAQLRSRMDHVSSMLQERLSGHELIQSYGQGDRNAAQFSSQAKQVMDSAVRGSNYSISFNQLAAFINRIGNTLIYCAGCYFFVCGTMEFGDVIAFCAYATQLLGPVVRFSTVANQLVQVGVSVDRIQEILDQEPAIREAPDAAPVETVQGHLRIDGVTFGYDQEHAVLRDVRLDIPPGTHLAVVGPHGAGRTTLAMLLRRFYDVGGGRIEFDGADIRELRLQDYRRAVAMVRSESALFDGTIRENVCYGKPEAAEERMIEVSKAIGLHEFVQELAEGYETKIGAGGLRVSAGIQQQIGVARALISEPGVLIVDEAIASLDPHTADTVNRAIIDLMRDRTCILVVHRLLMARGADQVAVIENGTVAQIGTHQELIRDVKGLYGRLFALQYGEDRLLSESGE